MLPGFRFLLTAIVLSVSMLIFGLGAAAVLRAAHEEFASILSRRGPPETIFSQQNDPMPTLAMLRVEPPEADQQAAEPATSDNAQVEAAIVAIPTEPETSAAGPDEIAALTEFATPAENSSQTETPEPEVAMPEISVAAGISAETDAPSPPVATKFAAIAETTPTEPERAAGTTTQDATTPVEDSTRIAETKIATLGGPPVTIEAPKPSKLAPVVVKKPVQTSRVVKRRRIAQRARVAPPPRPTPPPNPFGT